MPRFRPTAKLERSALADLYKQTLSRIPTVSGRLFYLAALRDLNSGTYKHHGLTQMFGRDQAVKALRESHQEAFQDWLSLSMSQKSDDLRDYLMTLDDSHEEVVDHWLKTRIYRSYIPASALKPEVELFCTELELLLEVRRNDAIMRRQRSAAETRDQGSSQLG